MVSERSERRYARRLIFAVLWLVLFDQFVPPLLSRLETRRYEGRDVFRFENSDLFALGPLVAYLREHPRGERRRVVFFGNSIMFGYGLEAEDAVPAQFQRLQPDTRVFNMAINGFETGNGYLISKAIIDSVDSIFVLTIGEKADPMLPQLIPMSDDDVRAFNLAPRDPIERRLESIAGVWHLYADNYRLQAALFGTSTRQYVYLHKGNFIRTLFRRAPPAAVSAPATPIPVPNPVMLRAPRSAGRVSPARAAELKRAGALEWQFAELAYAHRKRLVLLHSDAYRSSFDEAAVADFNATFAPFAEIVMIRTPRQLLYDRLHFTRAGSAALAEALLRHEREEGARR
jgi:hypothetical protein